MTTKPQSRSVVTISKVPGSFVSSASTNCTRCQVLYRVRWVVKNDRGCKKIIFRINYRPRVSSAVKLTQRSGLPVIYLHYIFFRSVGKKMCSVDKGAGIGVEVMQLNQGERIRKYRRQKGWSQEELGEMVHFSQSKISKIEHGDWDSLSDLRLIARVLEVPIEECSLNC